MPPGVIFLPHKPPLILWSLHFQLEPFLFFFLFRLVDLLGFPVWVCGVKFALLVLELELYAIVARKVLDLWQIGQGNLEYSQTGLVEVALEGQLLLFNLGQLRLIAVVRMANTLSELDL